MVEDEVWTPLKLRPERASSSLPAIPTTSAIACRSIELPSWSASSSTRLSDQCPIWAVYRDVDRQEEKPDIDNDSLRPANGTDLRPNVVFFTVVTITALALILNVLLAVLGVDSEATSTTYKMGFGAIVASLSDRVR